MRAVARLAEARAGFLESERAAIPEAARLRWRRRRLAAPIAVRRRRYIGSLPVERPAFVIALLDARTAEEIL